MSKVLDVALSILLLLCCVCAQQVESKQVRADEAIRMGVVEGTITMLNHKELGRAPFNGASFLVQRADCPKSVVAVHADTNGHYAISLSKGKYRIIMLGGGMREGEAKDLLAPSQLRFFEITGPVNRTQFNIDVLFPEVK